MDLDAPACSPSWTLFSLDSFFAPGRKGFSFQGAASFPVTARPGGAAGALPALAYIPSSFHGLIDASASNKYCG